MHRNQLSGLIAIDEQPPSFKNNLDHDFQQENDNIFIENNHENETDNIKTEKKVQKEYFSLQTKNFKSDDFFYYETENYKNYKYKLYNIDLDDIERKRLMGKKIHVSDYNLPSDLIERKAQKLLNIKQNIRKNETEAFQNKIHERNKKLTMMNSINKLSLELKIENSKKSLPKEKIEITSNETLVNQSNFPVIDKKNHEFKKQESEKLLNNRLLAIINKKKFPILNVSNKNENNEIKYRKKIGGGFTIVIRKNELQNRKKIKSVDMLNESLMKPSNPLTTINEQISHIIKLKKITKSKNVSDYRFKQKNNMNNYEEFISLSKITQDGLKLTQSGKKKIFFIKLHFM